MGGGIGYEIREEITQGGGEGRGGGKHMEAEKRPWGVRKDQKGRNRGLGKREGEKKREITKTIFV